MVEIATQVDAAAPPRAPLSKERVLDAAVALADEGGVDALSMRKIAQALGVVPMALYKHVANKNELLDGMIDAVIGEIDPPDGGADWKTTIRRRLTLWYTVALGVTILAFGTLLYLERRSSSVRELDQRLLRRRRRLPGTKQSLKFGVRLQQPCALQAQIRLQATARAGCATIGQYSWGIAGRVPRPNKYATVLNISKNTTSSGCRRFAP